MNPIDKISYEYAKEHGVVGLDYEKIYDAVKYGYNHAIEDTWKPSKEQSDNEDIDKVAQELYEHLYELKRRNNVPTNLYDKQEIINLWKAGIEYGRNHPKQEQPEVDLNDEIKKFIEEYGYERGKDKLLIAIVARHFFELGKTARKEESK